MLPLSGYYLAGDADVTGVGVRTARDTFATARPAGDLGDGVFNIRAVADYTLAPAVQSEHVAAELVLERARGGRAPLAALVPVAPTPGRSRPQRPVIALEVENDGGTQAVAPVLSLLMTDPRFLQELDRSVLPTAVEARTAPIPGRLRVEMTIRHPSELPAAPCRLRRPGRHRPEGGPRMRPRLLLTVLVALLLGACAQPPAAGGTALERALARVDGPFEGYLEFVDRDALSAAPAPWESLGFGSLDADRTALSDVLGVDLAAADALLLAGRPPRQVTLVLGGQDEERIRTRAAAAGWTGDGALRRELDLREPLTRTAGTVRPLGTDVALGSAPAPVELVDGPGSGLADEPEVRSMTACLGDVAVATLAGGELGPVRAVGLRRVPGNGTAATSVLCATATTVEAVTAAVTTGVSLRTGQPWSEILSDPQVEGLSDGVVRLVARNAPDVPPTLLLSALSSRDLPGVPR